MSNSNPARPVSYVRFDVGLLFDKDISDNVKVTLAQLKAMAYEAGNKSQLSVDPVAFENRTGKAKSTLHGHLSALRGLGVLQYTTSKDGLWFVVFGDFTGDPDTDSRNLESTALIKKNIDSVALDDSLKLGEAIYQQVTGFFTIPARAREEVGLSVFPMFDKLGSVEAVVDYLRPYWAAWLERGYNRQNCSWLTDWAVTGQIPKARDKPSGPTSSVGDWR